MYNKMKYINILNKLRMLFLKISITQTIIIGFASIILIGSIMLNLPEASKSGESIGYINALFTATSATCITGLVVVDTYSHWSLLGQTTILSLIQIGGLGFMTVATLFSFFLKRKIGLKERLLITESINNQSHLQGIVKLTKKIIIGTLIFEGIGSLILSFRFVPIYGIWKGIYKAVFHSISAFCNAGFDLMGEHEKYISLIKYVEDPVVNIVIAGLILLGGLGFVVWDEIYKARCFKDISLHTKLVLTITIILILFGTIFYFVIEFDNQKTLGTLTPMGKIQAAMFQAITPRTAGFNTINQADMTNTSIIFTMLLMFIGGSPGSTAGGIKTTTFGVIIYTVISIIKGKENTEIFRRRVNHLIVLRSMAITFISLFMIICTVIVLSLFEDLSITNILFETISAFGTVGLSLGITPFLSDISKFALILLMFSGRVGVLTIVVSLLPTSTNTLPRYKLPEEKIVVG